VLSLWPSKNNFSHPSSLVVDLFATPPMESLEHLELCSVCDPPKIIFHIQVLVVLLVCYHTHKTETGTANMWGTTNSKPSMWTNHYDGPIRNTPRSVRSYIIVPPI
jgi:hypothetical protein